MGSPGYSCTFKLEQIGAGYKIKRKTADIQRFFALPDLDSNQDKQNQNLSYYHYTIGQSSSRLKRSAKIRSHP